MTIITNSFDRAGELYAELFSEFLHINFIVRTLLVVFILWLVVFVLGQVFKYVFAPLVIILYTKLALRAWNYLFVETLQEWLYIRYHSKDKPSPLYLRLCDKIKVNRQKMAYTTYSGILHRGKVRRASRSLILICGITGTLWAGGFGMHQEYAAPAMVADVAEPTSAPEPTHIYEETFPTVVETPPPAQIYQSGFLSPVNWDTGSQIVLALTEQGRQGARLRNGPGIVDNTIIEILWDDELLLYMNRYAADGQVQGLYWLYVQTTGGEAGYISSQIVEIAVLDGLVAEEYED
ncbi:MAG: hypothetical protein FWC78_01485 [Defluviitaleaceae bacterium]|nr:hypothetical protein [Defluviitaleaceae bacterium]